MRVFSTTRPLDGRCAAAGRRTRTGPVSRPRRGRTATSRPSAAIRGLASGHGGHPALCGDGGRRRDARGRRQRVRRRGRGGLRARRVRAAGLRSRRSDHGAALPRARAPHGGARRLVARALSSDTRGGARCASLARLPRHDRAEHARVSWGIWSSTTARCPLDRVLRPGDPTRHRGRRLERAAARPPAAGAPSPAALQRRRDLPRSWPQGAGAGRRPPSAGPGADARASGVARHRGLLSRPDRARDRARHAGRRRPDPRRRSRAASHADRATADLGTLSRAAAAHLSAAGGGSCPGADDPDPRTSSSPRRSTRRRPAARCCSRW